ncbi:Protein transport protein sft2 [Umbelopsis sp. WA50703]
MSSSAESNFRNSLRGFNSTPRTGGIQLPTNGNQEGSGLGRTWASFTSGASDAFDNARRTVQGYVPVNAQEDVDEPWFQMSRWERLTACALCVVLGIACFAMAFFLWLPVLALFPGKFAATFTLGSILMLVSVALLRGPWAHVKHMMSLERLPFTAAYLGTMALTLYFSLGARNYILTIISAVLQIIALLW